MKQFIARLQVAYIEQPETLRKAERDTVALFVGLLVLSGALNMDTPDIAVLWPAVKSAAVLAVWRVGRSRLTSSA